MCDDVQELEVLIECNHSVSVENVKFHGQKCSILINDLIITVLNILYILAHVISSMHLAFLEFSKLNSMFSKLLPLRMLIRMRIMRTRREIRMKITLI